MNGGRVKDRNNVAKVASHFNKFYHKITSTEFYQIGNYQIVEEIGEGAFGKVYLAKHVMLNMPVVLKCGLIDDPNIVREIFYHRQLKHRNVVKLFEVIKTEKHLWMVQEYCEGNELYYYVYEKRRIEYKKCQKLFYQIVLGVKYVHSLELSHRDLKLENILLADIGKTIVKLTDFGFVREFDPKRRNFLSTVCGTTVYMAPEMLKSETYSGFAIDIWALGVILYTMLYGEMPFDEDDVLKTKFKIINEEPSYKDDVGVDAISLIKKMLSKDPSSRPSIEEILHSQFLSPIYLDEMRKKRSTSHDASSVVSLNQYYSYNNAFQSKLDRTFLRRLRKLDMPVEDLIKDLRKDKMSPLTALYELIILKEIKKKEEKRKKKSRYKGARKSLRNSRQKVKSVLSLDQMSSPQQLDRFMSSLSLATSKHSVSKFNIGDEERVENSQEEKKENGIEGNHVEGNHVSTTILGAQAAPSKELYPSVAQNRILKFVDESTRVSSSISNKSKNKGNRKLLNKLQFWKKDDEKELFDSGIKSPAVTKSKGSIGTRSTNYGETEESLTTGNAEGAVSSISLERGKSDVLLNSKDMSQSFSNYGSESMTRDSSYSETYSQKQDKVRPSSVLSHSSQFSHFSQHSTIVSESDAAEESDSDMYSEDEPYESSMDATLASSSVMRGSERGNVPPSRSSDKHHKRKPNENYSSQSGLRGRNSLTKMSSTSSDESSSLSISFLDSHSQKKHARNGETDRSNERFMYKYGGTSAAFMKPYSTLSSENNFLNSRRAKSPPVLPRNTRNSNIRIQKIDEQSEDANSSENSFKSPEKMKSKAPYHEGIKSQEESKYKTKLMVTEEEDEDDDELKI